ncbi:MAG: HTH domain-containing protein [Candidatus Zixiibacteriota bacterium]|nr:MAG: HTH domain-containing protein [candidate division Zixibacteria bacterium]
MGKLKRVLSLINLLTHRQQVTLDTIKNACGIPERTAYRYLRDISEANFPVYFDRDSRAYRLDRQAVTRIDQFNLEETILILVGLRRLLAGLNDEYKQDAEALVNKLLVRQPMPLEEVVDAYEHQLDSLSDQTNCSYLISSLLISAAIRCDKKVRISVDSDNSDVGDVKIDNPALRFKKHWQLVDADGSTTESADFLRIKKVSII